MTDDELSEFLLPLTVCADCGTFMPDTVCRRCHPEAASAEPAVNDTWRALNAIDVPDINDHRGPGSATDD